MDLFEVGNWVAHKHMYNTDMGNVDPAMFKLPHMETLASKTSEIRAMAANLLAQVCVLGLCGGCIQHAVYVCRIDFNNSSNSFVHLGAHHLDHNLNNHHPYSDQPGSSKPQCCKSK